MFRKYSEQINTQNIKYKRKEENTGSMLFLISKGSVITHYKFSLPVPVFGNVLRLCQPVFLQSPNELLPIQ